MYRARRQDYGCTGDKNEYKNKNLQRIHKPTILGAIGLPPLGRSLYAFGRFFESACGGYRSKWGPEGRQSVAPAVRPGFGFVKRIAPEGAEGSSAPTLTPLW